MTTIAYRDGWIVGEGRETVGERVDRDNCKKLYRLPNGSIFGGAGATHKCIALRQELIKRIRSKPFVLPSLDFKGITALFVDGLKCFFYEKGMWDEIKIPYAIGSGAGFALAAMDAGASAEEAVRIACKRDIYSGGRIQKYKVR